MDYIIKHADIYTFDDTDSVITDGYIYLRDGKIEKIGRCSDGVPECDVSYDAEGGILMPGMIDAHTHIGLCEDSLTFEGDDINETGDPITPHLRAIDGINPIDVCFREARESGVTCVAVSPGSANPIGGQIAVLKTVGKRVDKMALLPSAAVKMALGENPKGVYHSKSQLPETRMATAAIIREQLFKAKKYADGLAEAEKLPENSDDDIPDEPEFDIKADALRPVVEKKIPVHFHAHRADDIFTALRISSEFGIKPIIIHGTDGYTVADELSEEKIAVVAGPNLCDRSKPELKQQSFENPGILDRAGVTVAITTDHPVVPIKYLLLCAALAVKNGMDRTSALRAVTITPAKILGIDQRCGSVEVGKDADLVLFDGDPLDVMTNVKAVWIDGIKM